LGATADCKTAVPGSNPAISPAYSGLAVPRWDGNFTLGCPPVAADEHTGIYKRTSGQPKKIKETKKIAKERVNRVQQPLPPSLTVKVQEYMESLTKSLKVSSKSLCYIF
jgi:hypothetical protein